MGSKLPCKNFNFPKIGIIQALRIQASAQFSLSSSSYSFIYSMNICWALGMASCWKYQSKRATLSLLSCSRHHGLPSMPQPTEPLAISWHFAHLFLLPSLFQVLTLGNSCSFLRWQEDFPESLIPLVYTIMIYFVYSYFVCLFV